MTILYQPAPLPAMVSNALDEKHTHINDDALIHDHCHSRRRRLSIPAVLAAFLAIASLLALSFAADVFAPWYDSGSIWKRQNSGGTGTGTDNGVFVDHKLYLIIIFVGLFLVLILGIMLSAWCCRGSFENPLCCPCYLCACCGGLACLECVGCGLCAEGFEQV